MGHGAEPRTFRSFSGLSLFGIIDFLVDYRSSALRVFFDESGSSHFSICAQQIYLESCDLASHGSPSCCLSERTLLPSYSSSTLLTYPCSAVLPALLSFLNLQYAPLQWCVVGELRMEFVLDIESRCNPCRTHQKVSKSK